MRSFKECNSAWPRILVVRASSGAIRLRNPLLFIFIAIIFSSAGCARKATPSPPPPNDKSDVLIRHLLRRNSDLGLEIEKLRNEMLDHDNQCLREQIAVMEGRSIHHAKRDPATGLNKISAELQENFARQSQHLLDGEDWVEQHNLMHPESPWADLKDLLRDICGDCARERAIRDSQLKEEASNK